ncbi:hypothetical protein [Isoalcanivorax beigongshangi]|uniref:Uncharacterized protein n=1 Tax=Isoalcanivorax beigongshangi TaxID=3238810 RepID=A0ABV4AG84_9GAMM
MAESMQDALGYAYQQLMVEGEGVQVVRTATGLGVLSGASASYRTYDNLNATLMSKRAAYSRAFMAAQGGLVRHSEGLSQQCVQAMESESLVIDTGSETLVNDSLSVSEKCKDITQGMLSGAVVYAVDDRPEDKTVQVMLASSTRTRLAVDRVGAAVVATADPDAAFEHVAREISLGVVPPMGARLISNPETGENIVIGFGSAIIRQHTDAPIQRQFRQLAQRQSASRANQALVSFLTGTELYWSGSFDEKQLEGSQQFTQQLGEQGPAEDVERLQDTRHGFLNQLRMTAEGRAATEGVVPPGVQVKSFPSEDGYWMNTVAVYMPSLSRQARKAGDATAPAKQPSGGLNEAADNPRGPSGRVILDNDF